MTDGWFRPGVACWKGTPVPPVYMPIDPTPERAEIAEAVWWNGPAWTILRNGPQFVRQVVDFGTDGQIAFARHDVDREIWVAAIREAKAGLMSRGAYILWSIRLGLADVGMTCDWPRNAHVRDVRPLASATRQDLYERHRRHRELAAQTGATAR